MEDGIRAGKAYKLEASRWATDGLGLSKELHLHTDIGLRVHLIYLTYHRREDGVYFPMLMLRFNFNSGLSGPGEFSSFILKGGTSPLAIIPVKRMRSEPGADFISTEPDAFMDAALAFTSNRELWAELHGLDGVACDFPIPVDPSFYDHFKALRFRVIDPDLAN